jgi:hypothetical protein
VAPADLLERVDADGIAHPLVLQGDTGEGWAAKDAVRNLPRRCTA